ncbi:hypothetical protein CYMTET_9359 [Cymbomonas tetramitiformis]|uniref:HEAT repeat domain-containing protein n=1 Tax=Cymbomonas tetramitiformis TaxID=36881 RepID=A0AAE0GRX8_9CHLO|nr:hypothetical protein CYMTET_9359 [Cymbomonas tetramitiformis]
MRLATRRDVARGGDAAGDLRAKDTVYHVQLTCPGGTLRVNILITSSLFAQRKQYSSCLITTANGPHQPSLSGAAKTPYAGAIAARLEDAGYLDATGYVREAALWALGRLGEHAAPHAGAIAARLEDAEAFVRGAAVKALGRLGEHAAPHAGAIAARLEDAEAFVRGAAVKALGRLGEHAAPHAGAIVARLEDDLVLRLTTVEALGGWGSMPRHMPGLSRHDWNMPINLLEWQQWRH